MQFFLLLSHSFSDVTGRQSSKATTTYTTTLRWRAGGGCRTAHVLRVARTNFECGSDSARVASPCGSLVCLRQLGSIRVYSARLGSAAALRSICRYYCCPFCCCAACAVCLPWLPATPLTLLPFVRLLLPAASFCCCLLLLLLALLLLRQRAH